MTRPDFRAPARIRRSAWFGWAQTIGLTALAAGMLTAALVLADTPTPAAFPSWATGTAGAVASRAAPAFSEAR